MAGLLCPKTSLTPSSSLGQMAIPCYCPTAGQTHIDGCARGQIQLATHTALYSAAGAGQLGAVRLLLERGADTSVVGTQGETGGGSGGS
jgi:hypothetical protein